MSSGSNCPACDRHRSEHLALMARLVRSSELLREEIRTADDAMIAMLLAEIANAQQDRATLRSAIHQHLAGEHGAAHAVVKSAA